MQKRENSVISQKTSSPLEAENNHVVLEFETNEHNSNEESEEGDFIFEKRVPFEAFDESSDQFKTGKPEKESEEVIFCEPAALFCYTSREGNVRGVGDIKVLFNGVSKKAHLVMRKEHVLKVCLNRYIVKEMSFEWWDEKSMKWAAIDFFNNKPSCEIFAVQFETSVLAYKFKEAIEYAMKLIKEAEISGDQTPRTTEDLVNLPIRSNFSIKTNSPFTESVSTCLGETWQDKPFFGNSRLANFSEETTSVFSPGLELSLKNKFTAFPAFTQHSNFSANNSKPVFQSFGFKFETDDFADEGKHSILTEEGIVLDDSADEEKHSLSTEKNYSADEGKLSLSTEENIDESPDDVMKICLSRQQMLPD
ncbi:E3 SUMO-protein ligase RanBP2-like isoform X2 [Stegodyphus dumicola]|uniref:E3 SUMO-protein ligase RanBP2-like isoform X2 n=1 Tax=Stegodyphus dumicola TaxID=202533 RepID=UPI0015AF17C6|nr:E3 SUMO-protein ligase RanBP2-like isoform X2 [Stegodyphus dumicola]